MQNNEIIQSAMFFNLAPDQLEAIEQVLKQDTIFMNPTLLRKDGDWQREPARKL